MKLKLNVVSAHATALVSYATAFLAFVHPGFKVPTVVQAIVASLGIIIAGAIEAYHLLTHRQLQAAVAVALSTANKVEANVAPQPAPPHN